MAAALENADSRRQTARVAFVAGSAPSGYGKTSPEPNPTWIQVAQQLAKRLPNFVQVEDDSDNDQGGSRLVTQAIDLCDENAAIPPGTDVLVVLGVASPAEQSSLENILKQSTNLKAMLCDPTCGDITFHQRFTGTYQASSPSWMKVYTQLAPWTALASHQRLLQKTDTLLARKSSEDYLFAVLFVLNSLVMPIDVVKSDMYVCLNFGSSETTRCRPCHPRKHLKIFFHLQQPELGEGTHSQYPRIRIHGRLLWA